MFHKSFTLSLGLDPLIFGDPTPKKVLTPCQDLSDIGADFGYKTFFGVGSLDIWGSNPEESFDTSPSQDPSDIGADFAYKTFFGVGSLDTGSRDSIVAGLRYFLVRSCVFT